MKKDSVSILLVEDDEAHAEAVRYAFRSNGNSVLLTIAPTLEEAFAYLEVTTPDLVILDWLLPDGTGLELLPGDEEASRCPVVVMTSHGSEKAAVEAMKAGALNYVVKSEQTFAEMPRIAEQALREWTHIIGQRRAEKELKESEARLAKAQELAHLGSWDWDIDTGVVSCSDETFRIFGYDPKEVEITYELFISWVHPDDKEMVQAALSDAFAGVKPYDREFRIIRSDGAVRLLHSRGDVVANEQGRPTRMIGAVLDITVRKQLEEERDRLFNLSIDLLCIAGFDGYFKQLNPSWERTLGWTQEELLSKRWIEFVHPDDRDATASAGKELVDGKSIYSVENRHLCKDGSYRWLSWNAFPVPEEELIFAVARDITEQKRRADALRESEERYRTLFDSAVDAILILDIEGDDPGGIVSANESAAEMHGYTLEELLKLNIRDLDTPESAKGIRERVDRLLKGERLEEEVTHRRKDGTVFHVEINAGLLTLGDHRYALTMDRDITERKQAEEGLEKWAQIFEHAEWGVAVSSSDGKSHQMVNPAYARMHGYTMEELTGMPVVDVFTPESRAELPEQICIIHDKGHHSFESEHVRKDGSTFPVLIDGTAVKDDKGDVQYRIVNVQDITPRKKAEEKIREQNKFLNTLLESVSHPFYVVDANDCSVVMANSAAQRTFASGESTCYALTHGGSQPCVSSEHPCPLEELKKTGKPVTVEHVHVDKDGNTKNVEIFAYPIFGEDGALKQMVEYAVDISDRKRAEEALEQSVDKYRLLVQNAPIGVISIDTEGRITEVNQRLLEILGSPSAEATKSINVLTFPPLVEAGISESIKICMEENRPVESESLYTSKWGNEANLRMLLRPMQDSRGRVHGCQAIVEDVTERKNIEKQLRQAQKMEAIGTLSGGIAHDFNNLLTIILGYAELGLLEKSEGEPGHEEFQTILKTTKRGADLVRQILTFSRDVETKPRPISLNHQIQRAQKLLYKTIPKMIEIDLSPDEDLKTINADPVQVEQVLMNLAVNAKDAMPGGGRLVFETKNMTLDEEYCKTHLEAEPGEYVLLTVSDTGHGMEKEVLERIFEPFYSTKKPGEGTGLGLSMVHGIVKQNGGFIMCYSEPGEGTTFKIFLPVIDLDMEPDPASTGEMPAFGTETILLVDDEELIRGLGKRILTQAGHTVLTAENGQEALEVYRKQQADISLVILDLIMPEMGGRECLEELLKIDPNVKVLIASGFGLDASTKKEVETRAGGFVAKPFQMNDLLQRVRRVLDA